jgi:hypothetical protein
VFGRTPKSLKRFVPLSAHGRISELLVELAWRRDEGLQDSEMEREIRILEESIEALQERVRLLEARFSRFPYQG